MDFRKEINIAEMDNFKITNNLIFKIVRIECPRMIGTG